MDLQCRVFADQHAGGAGVIEVDVAQDQVGDVSEREAQTGESFRQPWKTRGRAAIEKRRPVVGLDEIAPDDALDAAVVEVD
jgi:hypothetical protein